MATVKNKEVETTQVPKQLKNGAETITPAQRKKAKKAWGLVIRFIDDCEHGGTLDGATEEISKAMKEHWAGGL